MRFCYFCYSLHWFSGVSSSFSSFSVSSSISSSSSLSISRKLYILLIMFYCQKRLSCNYNCLLPTTFSFKIAFTLDIDTQHGCALGATEVLWKIFVCKNYFGEVSVSKLVILLKVRRYLRNSLKFQVNYFWKKYLYIWQNTYQWGSTAAPEYFERVYQLTVKI